MLARWVRLIAAACAATVALLVATAPPASAHPFVIRTLPQAGYAVEKSPPKIGLVFDERVTFDADAIVVDGQGRGRISTSAPALLPDGHTLVVRPDEPLPEGRYTVHWQVVSEDGHSVSGTFGFGVGVSAPPVAAEAATETPGLPAAVAFRWTVFAGLALALGGLVGARLVRGQASREADRHLVEPRPCLVGGALAGAGGALGLAVHELGVGDLADGVAGFRLGDLLSSQPGRLVAGEVVGFGVAALAALRGWDRLTALALLAVVGAEAGRNHVYVEAGAGGWLLVTVHLAAAAIWIGALVHVCRAAFRWRSAPGAARALFVGYAMLAAVLYAAVVLSGTVAAVVVLPSIGALVSTSYGLVLVAKLVLVVAASALALTARRRLFSQRRLGPGLGIAAYVGGERALLVGVLAVAAVLASMSPPVPSSASGLAYPPPLEGDAVRVGALAGQVNVGLVAAQRHLEVHLATPETDPTTLQSYGVEGRLTSPAGATQALSFQPCGPGCFFAMPTWQPGHTVVDLAVTAEGWHGGDARLTVPWPIRERSRLLDRVLATLTPQRALTVREAVTSDTSQPDEPPMTDRIGSREFLRNMPYKAGQVGTVVELGRSGPNTWIGFGSPAQRIYARLLVSPEGRLLRQEIVSPRHLILDTVAYPRAR